MRGRGRCWFTVESKSFKISIEERGNLVGCILESSKGFCAWIKFGEKNLGLILE